LEVKGSKFWPIPGSRQRGRSKKVGTGRAGSDKKKMERAWKGEPVSIVLKTSFHQLLKR